MTREELREHCEKQVEACLDWHRVSGKPLGHVYEEHKLVLDLLAQEANKEKRLKELLESLQTANATNTTLLIQLVESKQKPCEDCVSRKEVIKLAEFVQSIKDEYHDNKEVLNYGTLCDIVIKAWKIVNLPSVTPTHNGWIPIVRREPTDEEKAEYLAQNGEELCYMLENKMPFNGQEVLVSIGEFVSEDVFYEDFYNFENNDIENVDAWMPKPTAYAKEMEIVNGKN